METLDQPNEWLNFKLNKQLLLAVEEAGFAQPTEIQRKCIPLILGGQQVIGIAQTGTGKTAAYLLPVLMKTKFAQGQNPRALVLAPTKELVVQITQHAQALSKKTDLRIVPLYGGIGATGQISELKSGTDILVATPGRFMDLYLKNEIPVKDIRTLVIDEADRMMDMGFIHQLRKVFEVLPVRRQNLLFSATFPEKVEKLSGDFLEFPHKVEVTPQATPAKQISQQFYSVPNLKTKINFLEYLLAQRGVFDRVIVFTRTKESANNVFKFIDRKGLGPVRVIHSNKGQNSRLNAIKEFGEGKARVLVATDVSARGIDISRVSHVINFEVPGRYEDYVHRIGRTGRAAEKGIAITMATEAEQFHIEKIQELIRGKIPIKELPPQVKVEEASFEEAQKMARALDQQRKRADPTFRGAFHEKKKKGNKKRRG
ncbi:MAG: DEAD/DEAH box helicase [Cyclobacteriaceae bacterium]|nr:DEAD/DEAH box helicase [Cyclobacteriaceae bacterium]